MPLPRPARRARTLAVAALAPLLACGEPTAVGALSLMHGRPFEGVITEAAAPPRHQWRVERASTGQPCDDAVLFGADDRRTRVLRVDGTPATVGDLVVGQQVSVWFTPIIAASCPGQTGAETIVLH